MKVFISWSGEASRKMADLLRIYLPDMLQSLKPFMSQHDLASGRRWSEQLSKELEESNFGIVCLTPDNLESPWILFEAGALTKHVEGRACCLLFRGLQPADVSGPLAQFQNRVFSRDGFQKLLIDLNDLAAEHVERASLLRIFEKWWPDLERQVTIVLDDPARGLKTRQRREQGDLLEELLVRVRNIQSTLEPAQTRRTPSKSVNVGQLLESIVNGLTSRQLSLLLKFVTPTGRSKSIELTELAPEYSSDEINHFIETAMIGTDGAGKLAVPDVLATYLADKYLKT